MSNQDDTPENEGQGDDETRIRGGSGAADVGDNDDTHLRGHMLDLGDGDEEGDATQMRGGDEAPEVDEAQDEDDETHIRAPEIEPTEILDDEDDATHIRSAVVEDTEVIEAEEAADDTDLEDAEDATSLRGGGSTADTEMLDGEGPVADAVVGSAEDETHIRASDDDATHMRSPRQVLADEDDRTEVNQSTQQMPAIGAMKVDELSADGDEDATSLRPENEPDDDDPTIAARPSSSMISDHDATLAGSGRTAAPTEDLGDDDATVVPVGGPAAVPGDDDITDPNALVQDMESTAPSQRPMPAPTPGAAEASAEMGPGTVLKGRFVLEDKLGAGGMGGVFKAVDLVKQEARDRNPHVAVKVLNENFAEHPDAFIALQRESSRTQRLSHPNIASVYDFDRDGAVAYMIMEMLKGAPLDSYLKKNRKGLEPEEARSIIRDISAALAYAHEQGLIHSDFKPGNIFFTDEGVAKVFDFGIARAASSQADDGPVKNEGPMDLSALEEDEGEEGKDSTLFDAGKLGALTPSYAAIEMFEGQDPAPQDDVYALGIVAYQCLTGKHPFNRTKAPVAEAKGMVPERPDGVTRREWNAIRRALAFKREDRTPDAQAFLDEFFGSSQQIVKAAAISVVGFAVVAAGLLYFGVIGAEVPIEPPEQWGTLDTQLADARNGVAEQLSETEFEANDQFVAWEGIVRREVTNWESIASPRLVVGNYPNEEAMAADRRQAFEQASIALRVLQPEGGVGSWHLLAGPWPADIAEEELAAMQSTLDNLGLDYRVERDDEAIVAARHQALDTYLAEIDRRMPEGSAPRVGLIQDEEGNWDQEQADIQAINDGIRQIESAEAVLARAESRFPERPADLAAARERVETADRTWRSRLTDGTSRLAYEQRQVELERARVENEEAVQDELDRIYAAKRDGGTVALSFTGEGDSFHEGVFRAFRLSCHQPTKISNALRDFPDLTPEDQAQSLIYATDCMNAKIDGNTDLVLESKELILAQADHPGIRAITRPDPCANRGYVGAGRNAFCIDPLDAGGAAPPLVIVRGDGATPNFGIGKYEVSVAEYNAYCRASNCPLISGSPRMPATGLSAEQAAGYVAWLSEQTGRTYRLPTPGEWLHAARADGSPSDPNRNCYSNVRGVVRGEQLVSVGQGEPNAFGLVNHVGNAEEFAMAPGGELVALGGRHTDPLAECSVDSQRTATNSGDDSTGFRVLRVLGR